MSNLTITWPGHQTAQATNGEKAENSQPTPAIVLPTEGKTLHAFGDEVTVHLGGAETGGQFTLFTDITPPEGGPPPHYHEHEDEWFLPLEGRVEFFLDGAWREVPTGSVVFVPRGTVHTFRNCGDTPSKMLTQTSPAGFEIFFERCAEEFTKAGPSDMGRIIEISAEHGIHYILE